MTNSFRSATFHTSAFELSQLIPDHGNEIAFAGRSNAGKSSAINCLTDQKSLCKTSKTPGRTQLINFFRLDDERHLVDLPGYGFAKVSKKLRQHWDSVLSTYLLHRKALKGLVIVVDIRRGISELDESLIDMLDNSLPLHILLTKSDKLSRLAISSAVSACEKQIDSSVHSVSSLSVVNRNGLGELESKCREWLNY
ncbi:MAG: YihA family ribosome biogenesis GTP-binding protein [Gammaproteobacteria bacterium]|nr:YihA family ribosome biogenesis GTP-binding protein [Gammaproteobacteria bacterium]